MEKYDYVSALKEVQRTLELVREDLDRAVEFSHNGLIQNSNLVALSTRQLLEMASHSIFQAVLDSRLNELDSIR